MNGIKTYLNGSVVVTTGDITLFEVDAIVNAANSSLLGGGGVDGAIHRAGGPAILEECRTIRSNQYPEGLPTGQAVATTGGRLKAKHVIHTVGPVWHGGKQGEDHLLQDSYRNSLAVAESLGVKTVAFPAISTGVYGFPKDRAAKLVAKVLKQYFSTPRTVQTVYLVFFSPSDADLFIREADPILGSGI
ncbi:MAG: O-acetyl-ADP-ribose deacetylase [Spirochaetes bacterium]|nr:O-acetyl-ADP-ribose deacetylase [Spirochaetota bacterium]